MNALSHKLRNFFLTLSPEKTLFEGIGLYSKVRVTKTGDRLNLYTGENFLQTYYNSRVNPQGNYFDWYLILPWFSGIFQGNIESLLILGLGGGSQVKLFNQVYNVKNITGVEIDPLIISLGKQYFDLNEANLMTISIDAYSFFDTSRQKYSHIIVDNFKENVFDVNCQSPSFFEKIHKHLTTDGVFLLNKLKDDPSNTNVKKELKDFFETVVEINIFYNTFFIATDSATAPKNAADVRHLLLKASELNKALKFFRLLKMQSINVI